MSLDPAIQTYLAESRELLDGMEQALLDLEGGASDPDLINAVFRAAHTIKGTGGIFGFDPIVAFTHKVESVLDRLRDGRIGVHGELIALLLQCGDHIRSMLEPVTAGEALETDEQERERELLRRLQTYLDEPAASAAPGNGGAVTETRPKVEKDEHTAGTDNWHISLRFGPDVLRNGMDPLSFLRYLGQMGDLAEVTTLFDTLPPAERMDPESCYLGFELAFRSQVDKAQIESAFDFVREDCLIRILPPHSKVSEYVALIEELPEDTLRLGEILVRSRALTEHELEFGLRRQSEEMQEEGRPAGEAPRPLGEILIAEGAVDSTVVHAALDKQQQVKERKAQENRTIRVDSEKLEQLINLVGELVIAGANTQLLAQQAGATAVIESTANLFRLVEDLRNNALSLQMVQIGGAFQRFQRVVRDVSKELGKEVDLAITGGDTELDKSVVERIGDPLMHLVRNALDHGIETPEQRRAAGKPQRATLGLHAFHDSGSIVIEISDDGRGLNRDKILQKALDRGLVNPGQNLGDREIYNLIFEAGFSTAEQVSNLSGRGVGMDVVRRNVEALRGNVLLESEPGKGTLVRIRLPLTLAIIDGFLVGIGRARYVIPMDMLVECLEFTDDAREDAERQGFINIRGRILPVLHLRRMFGIDDAAAKRENVVVVRFGEWRAGLVVDELLGEFQTVIKPLGGLFGHLGLISGSTILGSGEVALILDIPGLLKQCAQKNQRGLPAGVC
jgi:two-component system chemotaxis sensor kinase CheA